MAAVTVGQLVVELLGDTDKLKRDFKQIEVSARGLGQALAAVTAVGVGLAVVGKKVFDLGSSIAEIESKFQTVFGNASRDVSSFIDNFGTLAGLSQSQAKELVATTGAIAQGMGFAEDASAKFAIEITKVAGDLASFNDLPTADTLRRIQAALTGERESLKRLGIVILETDVQQRALNDTGKTNAKQLTQQEKATATLALITERAGVAMGDLARTQGSTANQAKRLGAEFRNIAENFATEMLPVLGEMLPLFRELATAAASFATEAARTFTTMIDAIGLTDPVVRTAINSFNQLTDAQKRSRAEQIRSEIATKRATIALAEQNQGFDFKAALGFATTLSDLKDETNSLVTALDIMEAALFRIDNAATGAKEGIDGLSGAIRDLPELPEAEIVPIEEPLEARVPDLPPPRMVNPLADAMERFQEATTVAQEKLAGMQPILNTISRSIVDLVTGFRSIGQVIKQIGFAILDSIVGALIQAIAKAIIFKSVFSAFGLSFLGFSQGGIVTAQRGLVLPGAARGGIPIIAHPGEAVLNRDAVRALGGGSAVDMLNKGADGRSISLNADFSKLPAPMTPREAALNAGWQDVLRETFLQLEQGGFRVAG